MCRSLVLFAAVAFRLVLPAGAQTFQPVYAFPADGSKGKGPEATLTVGPDTQLYGTTVTGGDNDLGTAFKVSSDGTLTPLGSLALATTGRNPYARLATPGDGFLYGVSERNGGVAGDPAGTVFKVDPAGGLSVVFQLSGSGAGPKLARALVATDSTTLQVLGASPAGLWQVATAGGGTNTYTFGDTAADGVFAYSLIRGSDGKLYGTTEGTSYVGTDPGLRGTLYRINANGSGITKLHDCLQGTGTSPHGAMVEATDGNFYGTMSAGGTNGYGVIFRLEPDGTYTVIQHLAALSLPQGDLMQATDGYLYGTASTGGANNTGGVFRIKPDGTGFKVLQVFTGANGARPRGGLVQATDGNLYGTTAEGGSGGRGTIYRINLDLPPPNRAPIATDDVGVSTGAPVAVSVLDNDFDPEGAALTVTSVSVPSHGTAVAQGDGTILYTPGGSFTGADSFTYTISDQRGLAASASVSITNTTPPAPFQASFYNGLLLLDPNLDGTGTIPRAQFFVKVSPLGKATGYILTRKKRISFSGNFAADGISAAKVTIPGIGKAVLFLGFSPGASGIQAMLFGRELWSGAGGGLVPSASLVKESFTVSVGQFVQIPLAGRGYAIMQILPSGVAAILGKLPDGTAFSCGTTLVDDGAGQPPLIPLFSEPMLGGYLAGVLAATGNSAAPYSAPIAWRRPPVAKLTAPYAAGFVGGADLTAFTYVPPLSVGDVLNLGSDNTATVGMDGGPLAAPVAGSFLFNGAKLVPSLPLKSIVLNRKTGLFTGRILVGKTAVSFGGAVFQGANQGGGFFRVGTTRGNVDLTP